jgi:hypothetical protein
MKLFFGTWKRVARQCSKIPKFGVPRLAGSIPPPTGDRRNAPPPLRRNLGDATFVSCNEVPRPGQFSAAHTGLVEAQHHLARQDAKEQSRQENKSLRSLPLCVFALKKRVRFVLSRGTKYLQAVAKNRGGNRATRCAKTELARGPVRAPHVAFRSKPTDGEIVFSKTHPRRTRHWLFRPSGRSFLRPRDRWPRSIRFPLPCCHLVTFA